MEADFVIVGAGSAGCALAHRLSEDQGNSVILIEHGGRGRGPLIQMPGALSYPMHLRSYDWGLRSEPEPALGGRRLAVPRGKVLGGSSAINGMVYVRGHARDFDHWAACGAEGWAYADVLPYFKRLEDWHDGGHGGDAGWRGTGGPVRVTRAPRLHPLAEAFIQAGVEAGYSSTADCNGQQQEGFGPFDRTIWRGRRWSAAWAYLRPALARPNLRLVRGLARSVLTADGRAGAVEIRQGRSIVRVRARREVILAASAINSPKLLLLSGIGPAEELEALGVPVVAHRPGVGRNLQDHLEVTVQMACRRPITLHRYWNPLGKAATAARWLLTRTGPGASNHFDAGAFIRSEAGVAYPDIQLHFLPIAVRYDGRTAAQGHGFQAHVGPMRSQSRGSVTLRSADPEAPPLIRFNAMSQAQDWAEFRRCIRLTREILSQKALRPYAGGEIQPGEAVRSDEQIDAFIAANAESAYHPCGTCRMGAHDDPMAVVDPDCRVIGVSGLRVADSSIFPRITNGNLNAPSMMVGEKAADHILGRSPPNAQSAEPWNHPQWRQSQR